MARRGHPQGAGRLDRPGRHPLDPAPRSAGPRRRGDRGGRRRHRAAPGGGGAAARARRATARWWRRRPRSSGPRAADGGRAGDLSQWSAFTGQAEAECAGRGWLEVVHPDDRAAVERAWKEAVRQRPHAGDAAPAAPPGRRVPPHGGARGAGARRARPGARVGRRARRRHRPGEGARSSSRQAQKLQAVGTLAGGVAHEVNNQLMAVLGFGDFVLKELGPEHPQASDVEEMIRAATRAAQVAQQLLTFSRRQVEPDPGPRPARRDRGAGAGARAPARRRQDPGARAVDARGGWSWPTRPRWTRCSSTWRPTRATRWAPAAGSPSRSTTSCSTRATPGPTANIDLAAGDLRAAQRLRQRLRHGSRDAGQDLRALLHHQAGGQGHRTRPLHGLRDREAARGLHLGVQRARPRHHHQGLLPGRVRRRSGRSREPGGSGARRGRGDPRAGARVLVVEDEAAVRSLVRRSLEAVGVAVLEAENGREALEVLARDDAAAPAGADRRDHAGTQRPRAERGASR